MDERKALPIGISDFARIRSDYYYVDKTLLIKEILDKKPLVSLFTRPRRFGKTLNMDMLRVFFEQSEEDTSAYFRDAAIWKCGPKYTAHQGAYPVISLTFKDVKFDSWDATLCKIGELLQIEFGRHRELMQSDRLASYELRYFSKILDGRANEVELSSSLENLSRMLCQHYGKKAIIIIDEYDAPIQEGHARGFYEKATGFMRNLFSGAFKDNRHLAYGFLTGILRIAHESIFSGLNNLHVNSILDRDYAEYFGFTYREASQMMECYGLSEKDAELKEWYNGYVFGDVEIYNPWSVLNYIAKGGVPEAYWANTAKNEILGDVLETATDDVIENLYSLLRGEGVIARIDQSAVYPSISKNPSGIYSLLFVSGYLKATRKELQADGSYLCEIRIPNKEVASVYKKEILSHLLRVGAVTESTADKITESLYENDLARLQDAIADYMNNSISYYDTATESFYHGLTLGLLALLDSCYKITSNQESGDGRYDICLTPKDERYPGIIMELKSAKGLGAEELEQLSETALKQIDEKRYDSRLRQDGILEIIKLGIAFSGKNVKIKSGWTP